jgi:hypothetical protein
LALDLVHSWAFRQPTDLMGSYQSSTQNSDSLASGRPFFSLANRRSSILIDIPVPSLPPTRASSPTQEVKSAFQQNAAGKEIQVKKTGLGSLMKTAKQDVQVPEFDMGSFF